MQKHIELTHQAVAAYSSRHFERVIVLLQKAFTHLHLSDLRLSNATYNAIFDAVEMVELLFEYLPILEKREENDVVIQSLKNSLNDLKEVSLTIFSEQLTAFNALLNGLQIGFDFFLKQELSLLDQNPIVSFALIGDGQIQLSKCRNSEAVTEIIAAFNTSFLLKSRSLNDCQNEVKKALLQNDRNEAMALLLYMMEAYPESKKQAFLELGNLYFEDKAYQKATEAYMKTIVMGTPKEQLKTEIQTACNALARNAQTSKEANRWRELLMNFFG